MATIESINTQIQHDDSIIDKKVAHYILAWGVQTSSIVSQIFYCFLSATATFMQQGAKNPNSASFIFWSSNA